jgi:hypothetical protein
MSSIDLILDLDRYPIDRLASAEGRELVARCREDVGRKGMFSLEGLVRAEALAAAVRELRPVIDGHAFVHERSHNIFFRKEIPGLAPGHPALRQLTTRNRTICADQMPAAAVVLRIYEWPAMAAFLAATMQKPVLHTMPDPLARVNVMEYRAGEALNWHFDRSEFTTTLLLQAPEAGGEFEYRTDLRSDADPNYEGVAALLEGRDPEARIEPLTAGTLNVFRGKNTAHRVTPVKGKRERIIAVFSYYERPGVLFTAEERVGFYGRAG